MQQYHCGGAIEAGLYPGILQVVADTLGIEHAQVVLKPRPVEAGRLVDGYLSLIVGPGDQLLILLAVCLGPQHCIDLVEGTIHYLLVGEGRLPEPRLLQIHHGSSPPTIEQVPVYACAEGPAH